MALTSSNVTSVGSWIDTNRPNIRCGYIDVEFDDDPTTGYWAFASSLITPGLTLLKLSSENAVGGINLWYDMTNARIYADVAAGTAVTDELDEVTVRFYWEGY